jgi:hypothetical protein
VQKILALRHAKGAIMFSINFKNAEVIKTLDLIEVDTGIYYSKSECAFYALHGSDTVVKISLG